MAGRSCVPGYRAGERRYVSAGLSLLLTGVTIGDFSGGGTALAGSLAEVTWGVGAGQGLLRGGECGGSRLVGSEKSSIMTLSAVCGAGWADRERTFATRTAFSHRTRGWDLSHLQEIAVLAGYRSSRYVAGARRSDAAGTVRRPAAARALREAGGSLCVRGAGPCRRSLSAPGMDCGPPGLSQSDSRLGLIAIDDSRHLGGRLLHHYPSTTFKTSKSIIRSLYDR